MCLGRSNSTQHLLSFHPQSHSHRFTRLHSDSRQRSTRNAQRKDLPVMRKVHQRHKRHSCNLSSRRRSRQLDRTTSIQKGRSKRPTYNRRHHENGSRQSRRWKENPPQQSISLTARVHQRRLSRSLDYANLVSWIISTRQDPSRSSRTSLFRSSSSTHLRRRRSCRCLSTQKDFADSVGEEYV